MHPNLLARKRKRTVFREIVEIKRIEEVGRNISKSMNNMNKYIKNVKKAGGVKIYQEKGSDFVHLSIFSPQV